VRFIITDMAKKDKVIEKQHQEDPQILLEKIMKTEVTSAERIAAARKDAEQQISEIQDKAAQSKKEAYASGRRARTRLVEGGLNKARSAADEKIKKSTTKADRILKKGQDSIAEAVNISVSFIIGEEIKEKSS